MANVDRGERYRRTITQSLGDNPGQSITVDIADICEAFGLSYMLAQAVKKISLAGQRGAKEREQDLREAMWHIEREIQLAKAADLGIKTENREKAPKRREQHAQADAIRQSPF